MRSGTWNIYNYWDIYRLRYPLYVWNIHCLSEYAERTLAHCFLRTNFEKQLLGVFGPVVFRVKCASEMIVLRTKSMRTKNQAPKVSGQMTRSQSLEGLKIIAESKERNRPFWRFPFFEKKKSRPTAARSEQCSNGKRRTLSKKSHSASCISLPKVDEETSKFDSLPRCGHAPHQTPSHTKTNSSRTKAISSPTTKLNDPSLTTGGATCSPLNSHRRLKEIQLKDTTKRESRVVATRHELELAIGKDDRSELQSVIRSKTFDLNHKDYYGKTLLHTASSVGNYRCAQILINAGADVDIQDRAGFAPLHCAVMSNHVPCVAVLLSAGANLVAQTRTMHTPLTLACQDEMILLIGRSLLLRGNTQQRKHVSEDKLLAYSLRETYLWIYTFFYAMTPQFLCNDTTVSMQ